MAIRREKVDRHAIDLSGVVSEQGLSPVHPGKILRAEFLEPMALNVYRLARAVKVPRPRLNDIVLERRGIIIDTTLRLGRYFGTTPDFWLNLQTRYELDMANRTLREKIAGEVIPQDTFAATP